jgi:hypothetical protein
VIDPRARAELFALVRDYRSAERRQRDLRRRLERAERDLARDAFRPSFVVEHAVARSLLMATSASAAALRDAIRCAQRRCP